MTTRNRASMAPDALFDGSRRGGAALVEGLAFISDGPWGFEVTDADGHGPALIQIPDPVRAA